MTAEQRLRYQAGRRRYRTSVKGKAAKRSERERARRRKMNSAAGKRNVREKIFLVLGNRCARCGYDDPRAFQIDHVHGDGAIERRRAHVRKRNAAYFRRVLRSVKAGEGRYQLLCANCNWIKAYTEDVHRPKVGEKPDDRSQGVLPLFAAG